MRHAVGLGLGSAGLREALMAHDRPADRLRLSLVYMVGQPGFYWLAAISALGG